MKKLAQYIFTGLILISPFSVNATAIYPSNFFISPTAPTTADFLTAEVNGDFASPGYVLNGITLVDNGSNSLSLNFDITEPGGIVLAVLDPFSYSFGLGLFAEGDYLISANFFISSLVGNSTVTRLDNTIRTAFSVTAAPQLSTVPLPATIWLFIGGISSLLFFRRQRKSLAI